MSLKARQGGCEEASPFSREGYIPCNAPAVRMISWPDRGEGPYRMCGACADHSVRNRGATDIGPYEGPPLTAVPLRADTLTADAAAYEADAADPTAQDENLLSRITRLAREAREAEADVERANAALKAAQDRVRGLVENMLPNAMDEAQQKKLTTTDGWELSRGEILRASIPPALLDRAIMWLNANGAGSIVKREFKLEFGKGEDQKAAEAHDLLLSRGFAHGDKQSVHPQTLQATLKEKMAAGQEVPMDLFGVYIQPIVRMKGPKGA